MAQKPQPAAARPGAARPAPQPQRPVAKQPQRPAQPARPAAQPQRPAQSPRVPAQPRQEVATRPQGGDVAMVDNLPEFMRGDLGAGTEKIGAGDIETPRIKLIQAASPEIQEFQDAKPGHFWHSIGQMDLGQELVIVPLYIDIRAILWRPRDSGGGILARSDDGISWTPPNARFEVQLDKKDGGARVTWETKPTVAASRLLEWGTMNPNDPNSPPAATKMYNVVVALPEFQDFPPAVVTLQRSAIKVARKFTGQLKIIRAPSFGCKFFMRSVLEQGPSGPFYNYGFTAGGFIEDANDYEQYKAYYEAFKAMGLQIKDIEGLQDDPTDTGDTGNDPNAPSY